MPPLLCRHACVAGVVRPARVDMVARVARVARAAMVANPSNKPHIGNPGKVWLEKKETERISAPDYRGVPPLLSTK